MKTPEEWIKELTLAYRCCDLTTNVKDDEWGVTIEDIKIIQDDAYLAGKQDAWEEATETINNMRPKPEGGDV